MTSTSTSTTTSIPGTGMSYSDLCDTKQGTPERTMWSALGDLASILGVSLSAGYIGNRSRTTDEYVEAITEIVGTDFDIAAAALAAKALNPGLPKFEQRYEIRRLTSGPTVGSKRFIIEETLDTFDLAAERLAEYEANMPEDTILAIVKVETTIKTDVYPKDYVPRR